MYMSLSRRSSVLIAYWMSVAEQALSPFLLADRGLEVTGLDPAGASLRVARAKTNSERVRWICGDAKALPKMQVDLATMTGNVAQAIVDPSDWDGTLRGVHDALRPGGLLVFETRVPAKRAWHEWNRAAS